MNVSNRIPNQAIGYPGPALQRTGPAASEQANGLSELWGKALSELNEDEMRALGVGSALDSLVSLQGDITLGEAAPLLGNPTALDSIVDLMTQRPDLKIGDFLQSDINGRVSIDPSYKSGETMEFLKNRPDVSPQEVTSMRDTFTRMFRDPLMGKWATEMGFELMQQRPDLKPQDMVEMMDTFARAAGMGQQGEGGSVSGSGSAGAALDMFSSASRLLVKRPDMQPERLGELATSVGRLASPDDPNRGRRVAEGFDSAIVALENNPLREPEEFSRLATVIGSHFKGQDENSAALRMNAFSQSARMMGENSEISPDAIDGLLSAAKSRNPKNNQPRALGNALTSVFDGVNQGLIPGSDLSMNFRPTPARPGSSTGERRRDEANEGRAGNSRSETSPAQPGGLNQPARQVA